MAACASFRTLLGELTGFPDPLAGGKGHRGPSGGRANPHNKILRTPLTILPGKCYSGHYEAAPEDLEDGDQETPGKESGARNVDGGLQVQLEEEGGDSTRQSWVEWLICSTGIDKA